MTIDWSIALARTVWTANNAGLEASKQPPLWWWLFRQRWCFQKRGANVQFGGSRRWRERSVDGPSAPRRREATSDHAIYTVRPSSERGKYDDNGEKVLLLLCPFWVNQSFILSSSLVDIHFIDWLNVSVSWFRWSLWFKPLILVLYMWVNNFCHWLIERPSRFWNPRLTIFGVYWFIEKLEQYIKLNLIYVEVINIL